MDLNEIEYALNAFVAQHESGFTDLGRRQSQLLEMAATIGVVQHYQAEGFDVHVSSLDVDRRFVVKTSTRGHPAKYSRVTCAKADEIVEIHMNTVVRGAHDDGRYCVDVGIVKPNVIPIQYGKGDRWECIPNEALVSFAEAKRLNIYPMLLAQFIGIVHEIKPAFLKAPTVAGFGSGGHMLPTLVVLGHFSGNSRDIVRTYASRGVQVNIAEEYDVRLMRARLAGNASPIVRDAETCLAGVV